MDDNLEYLDSFRKTPLTAEQEVNCATPPARYTEVDSIKRLIREFQNKQNSSFTHKPIGAETVPLYTDVTYSSIKTTDLDLFFYIKDLLNIE